MKKLPWNHVEELAALLLNNPQLNILVVSASKDLADAFPAFTSA